MKFDFEIDTGWCLDQLLKDGKITERDRMRVQTTHRQREQIKWHPYNGSRTLVWLISPILKVL